MGYESTAGSSYPGLLQIASCRHHISKVGVKKRRVRRVDGRSDAGHSGLKCPPVIGVVDPRSPIDILLVSTMIPIMLCRALRPDG